MKRRREAHAACQVYRHMKVAEIQHERHVKQRMPRRVLSRCHSTVRLIPAWTTKECVDTAHAADHRDLPHRSVSQYMIHSVMTCKQHAETVVHRQRRLARQRQIIQFILAFSAQPLTRRLLSCACLGAVATLSARLHHIAKTSMQGILDSRFTQSVGTAAASRKRWGLCSTARHTPKWTINECVDTAHAADHRDLPHRSVSQYMIHSVMTCKQHAETVVHRQRRLARQRQIIQCILAFSAQPLTRRLLSCACLGAVVMPSVRLRHIAKMSTQGILDSRFTPSVGTAAVNLRRLDSSEVSDLVMPHPQLEFASGFLLKRMLVYEAILEVRDGSKIQILLIMAIMITRSSCTREITMLL